MWLGPCVPQSTVFHVARNQSPSVTELLNSFAEQLRSILSASWMLTAQPHSDGDRDINAMFELTSPRPSQCPCFHGSQDVVEPRYISAALKAAG